jgi:hypothetical protein
MVHTRPDINDNNMAPGVSAESSTAHALDITYRSSTDPTYGPDVCDYLLANEHGIVRSACDSGRYITRRRCG